jgi:hypothetical protein
VSLRQSGASTDRAPASSAPSGGSNASKSPVDGHLVADTIGVTVTGQGTADNGDPLRLDEVQVVEVSWQRRRGGDPTPYARLDVTDDLGEKLRQLALGGHYASADPRRQNHRPSTAP